MKTLKKFTFDIDHNILVHLKPWRSKRLLLKLLTLIFACLITVLIAVDGLALGKENRSRFSLPQISYQSGNFNPRPKATESLLVELAKRTSVEVKRDFLPLELTDSRLFYYPMIYLSGNSEFSPFNGDELGLLRNYLNLGGFLFIDDCSGVTNSDFDNSVRTTISQLFPNIPLQKIPRDHSIFRSFYLINQVTGRVSINPYLEGIDIKGRTVLVYSTNDLGGAWSKNKLGHWTYDIVAGGTRQRTISTRLGINIIIYALTLDYKKDMVHLPIILERLQRFHRR